MKTKILGLTLTFIGLLTILYNPRLTGFTISEFSNNSLYLLPSLILIFIGFLITLSGDSLQDWLEKKEKKKQSPSLEKIIRKEGEIKQTKEEKQEFKNRYSGRESLWKKLTGKHHVEQIPQKQAISNGSEDYTGKEKSELGQELIINRRENNQEELNKKIEKIKELKKELISSKQEMNKHAEKGHYSENAWNKYTQSATKLSELYNEIQIPFTQKRYQDLKNPIAKKGVKKAKENYEEGIRENKFIVKDSGKARALRREMDKFNEEITNPEEFGETDYDLTENSPIKFFGWDIMNSSLKDLPENATGLARLYKKGIIKGMPISKASDKYHAVFTHSLPSDSPNPNARTHIKWNNKSLNNDQARLFKIEDFIKILQEKKPMISASSISYDNQESAATYGPYGVIINEGEIFDASSTDMGSEGRNDMLRLRKAPPSYQEDLPIQERIEYAIKNTPRGQHNEFIVGNYNIGGLYIQEAYKNDKISNIPWDERVKYIAQEAVKYNLPLYVLTEKKEFQEINPQEILSPPKRKRATSRTPRKTATKKTTARKSSSKKKSAA